MAISAPAPGILPSRQPSPAPLPIRIWRDGVHWMGSLRCRCRCRVALPWSGAACRQRSAVNVNGTRLERPTSMSRGCPIAYRRHCASFIVHRASRIPVCFSRARRDVLRILSMVISMLSTSVPASASTTTTTTTTTFASNLRELTTMDNVSVRTLASTHAVHCSISGRPGSAASVTAKGVSARVQYQNPGNENENGTRERQCRSS